MSVAIAREIMVPVDTARVVGRRELRFDTLEETWDDAQSLAQQDVRLLGNWSLGQIFQHLAEVMHMSIDGAPFRAPLHVRIAARLMKRRILNRGVRSGIRLPPAAARVLVPGETSVDEGLKALRLAIDRLHREEKRSASFVLGRMTREEYDLLHLRHAELHLSFVVPV